MSEQELNKIIAKNISYYLESSGKTQLDLATYMGFLRLLFLIGVKELRFLAWIRLIRFAVFFIFYVPI